MSGDVREFQWRCPPDSTDARIVAELAASLASPRKNPDQDGASFVLVPPEWTAQALPTSADRRPDYTVRLRDARSFIEYVKRCHVNDATVIYATLQPARFLAVLTDPQTPGMHWPRDWRADFTVPPSREWTLWNGMHGRQASQLDFARFIQDNLPDIIAPDGADLLALVLNFEASISGQFANAQRLQDGSSALSWRSETATGTLKVPELITLSIPVFENEPRRELTARLRYRIKEGSLSLWYELVRPHVVLDVAFRELWERIEKDTGRLLLLGTPE